VREAAPDVPVVVVINACSDDTEAQAKAAGATVLRSGSGYARALRTGFIHALRVSAPWVVQMDGDGQHPAEGIAALRHSLRAADLVVGSRFIDGPGYPMPLDRNVGIQILGRWASICARQRLRDITSGFRAWRPDALAMMVADYPEDVADANVLVRAVRRGLVVREIAVPMRARDGGVSMHTTRSGVGFALRMAVLTGWEAVR
jgi:glycosyltransferase involved in cell wall biosynthesis